MSLFSPDIAASLRQRFGQIETGQGLANLVNEVYRLRFPNRKGGVRVELRQLTFYAFKPEGREYKYFEVAKRSGGTRRISAPRYKLKTIQKCIAILLELMDKPHNSAYGFVRGRNVVENARKHINKAYVYNIDLADFFSSISYHRVRALLRWRPFQFAGEGETVAGAVHGRDYLGFLLANICCNEGCLPQGAPTSPILSNLAARRLDKRLERLAQEYKLTYTRYADDITFSGGRDVFAGLFRDKLLAIIAEEGFTPNLKKERLQKRGQRQMVTGIVVNEGLNLPKTYTKNIRYWLHYWKTRGETAAVAHFVARRTALQKYLPDKKDKSAFFKRYLLGKIQYLGLVKGSDNQLFINALNTYKKVLANPDPNHQSDTPLSLTEIAYFLRIWQEKGLDEATNLFNNNA